MADWYCSSASYAAIATFVPSAVYSVGNIVKPTAPALKAKWVFRCTTAGTAGTEPAWPTGNSATVTTGGATFTNVTGQSAFGWGVAAGDLPTVLANRYAAGDRVFISSDHTETQTTTTEYGFGSGASYTSGQVLSVNRAGSVPPVAADLTAGAVVTVSGSFQTLNFSSQAPLYYYGITFAVSGSSSSINFGNGGGKTLYFDACQFFMNTGSTTITAGGTASLVWNNTTLQFTAATQFIRSASIIEILWQNTPSAIVGTIPTILFSPQSGQPVPFLTARGVDLSALTTTLVTSSVSGTAKCLLDSCRIASGVVRYTSFGTANGRELVELVNCYDGTNFISESWQSAGAVTTETTITLTGGATDNVGTFAHKMVSSASAFLDKLVEPLTGFWMDANNTAIGSSKTATVEIISSASLNNDEISLVLEYLGTTSSSLASMATSLPATVLTAASAVTTSTATWNASPATPVKQKLQVTFTPRTAGRVRAQVRLGKASATVYVNPQVAIT